MTIKRVQDLARLYQGATTIAEREAAARALAVEALKLPPDPEAGHGGASQDAGRSWADVREAAREEAFRSDMEQAAAVGTTVGVAIASVVNAFRRRDVVKKKKRRIG